MASLPKRFPDRVDIASVRAEAEAARARGGGRRGAPDRRPGDGAPRPREARLPRPGRPLRPHPAPGRRKPGRAGRPRPRRHRRSHRQAGEDPARRALPRCRRAAAAGQDPRPAPGHVPRRHRRRAALPPPLPRPAHERGDARGLPDAHAHRHRDPPLPRRERVPRGRDADPAAALRRRLRRAVRHALERARHRRLPAHRNRALSQAPHRRRPRARVRDREGLPQRRDLLQAPAGVHDGRVVRGVRRLPRHDGAPRGADRAPSPRRRSARRR